jgi:hypothetical protein
MFPSTYLRPVAYHRVETHRLLLKDEAGTWYLWMGDDEEGLIEIERPLAQWIYRQADVYPVSGPAMWFHVNSLPLAPDHSYPR